MERGSYSKLDQIDQIQIELTEPSASSSEPSTLHFIANKEAKRIDYVLVYDTLTDTKELDDDSVKEMRKLEGWRNTFEKFLENKLGLVLQHKVVDIEDVSFFS